MLCKVTHCAGRVSANTRPHQLRWGDREMGTAIISCVECSQVAGLIQKVGRDSSKSTVSSCSCPSCSCPSCSCLMHTILGRVEGGGGGQFWLSVFVRLNQFLASDQDKSYRRLNFIYKMKYCGRPIMSGNQRLNSPT